MQYVDGHFVDSYYPTIENTFSKTIRYKSQDFATEIVDTAGQVSDCSTMYECSGCSPTPQDEYSILNSKHFIGIHGYMLVYSVSSLPSFEMVQVVREKILNHLVRPFPLPSTNLHFAAKVTCIFHNRAQNRYQLSLWAIKAIYDPSRGK